jgi:hypothetical protein
VFDRPLAQVLQSKEAMGRIAKWVVEIGQYDVEFIPRLAIKSQALIDLLVNGRIWVCEALMIFSIIGYCITTGLMP